LSYFQVNEETNELEITYEWFSHSRVDATSHPVKITNYQGSPHSSRDTRFNNIPKETADKTCHLPDEIRNYKKPDYRFLWRPTKEVCSDDSFEKLVKEPLPFVKLRLEHTIPKGEKLQTLMKTWVKLAYCSTDYLSDWIEYSTPYNLMHAMVWVHTLGEVEAGTEIEMTTDKSWANFWNIDYVYGETEAKEGDTVVVANDHGHHNCYPKKPCFNGNGPCITNKDCHSNLICLQRSKENDGFLVGYDLNHIGTDVNICVKKDALKKRCVHYRLWQDCTQDKSCKWNSYGCSELAQETYILNDKPWLHVDYRKVPSAEASVANEFVSNKAGFLRRNGVYLAFVFMFFAGLLVITYYQRKTMEKEIDDSFVLFVGDSEEI